MLGYMKRKIKEANQAATDKKAELAGQKAPATLADLQAALRDKAAQVRERSAERAEAVRGGGMQGVKDQHRERATRDQDQHQISMAWINYVYQDDARIKATTPSASARLHEMRMCRKARKVEWAEMTDAQRQEWVR